ncbi:hypothetical protein [Candidatus Neptunichlamydia sp. REUL1]|nr:hypothetical protein [Candidatus Neptunochlamydia sp. REUL1]
MKTLVLNTHFSSLEELDLQVSEVPAPKPKKESALLKCMSQG